MGTGTVLQRSEDPPKLVAIYFLYVNHFNVGRYAIHGVQGIVQSAPHSPKSLGFPQFVLCCDLSRTKA